MPATVAPMTREQSVCTLYAHARRVRASIPGQIGVDTRNQTPIMATHAYWTRRCENPY